jgi:hypothetical protein
MEVSKDSKRLSRAATRLLVSISNQMAALRLSNSPTVNQLLNKGSHTPRKILLKVKQFAKSKRRLLPVITYFARNSSS